MQRSTIVALTIACLATGAAEPAAAQSRSVCDLSDTPGGATVALAGEVRLEGPSPVQQSNGIDPPPPQKGGPGRMLLTSPECPEVAVTVSMSREFNHSILAFAFYMTLDLPHYRSGESRQRVVLQGTWHPEGQRLTDADLLEME